MTESHKRATPNHCPDPVNTKARMATENLQPSFDCIVQPGFANWYDSLQPSMNPHLDVDFSQVPYVDPSLPYSGIAHDPNFHFHDSRSLLSFQNGGHEELQSYQRSQPEMNTSICGKTEQSPYIAESQLYVSDHQNLDDENISHPGHKTRGKIV